MTRGPSVRSLVTGGFALTTGAVLQAVGGLAAQLVLMRLLFPEEFGRFAVVLAGCGLAQAFLSLRLNVLIIRLPEAELTPARVERYRTAMVWESVLASAVVLGWLAATDLLTGFAAVLVAALTLAHWTNSTVAFYERRMAYGSIAAVETGSQLFGHLLAVALVALGAGAVALYVRELAVALARLAAFARIGALVAPAWRLPARGEIGALVGEMRAIWLEGVSDNGFARVVVLLTGSVAGLHGTGVFTQSQRLALIPHQLLGPVVVRLASNAFSRSADPAYRRRLLAWLVGGTLAGLAVAAAVAATFADPVVPLLFGAHWSGVVGTLGAMAGVIVFFSSFELLRSYCFAVGALRLLLIARTAQYAAFLAGGWMAVGAADPVTVLAWALSAAYASAFAVVALGLAATRSR